MKNTIVTLAIGILVGGLVVVGIAGTMKADAKPSKKVAPAYSLDYNIHPFEGEEHTFLCEFTVSDLTTGEVILSPVIKTEWGVKGELQTQARNVSRVVTCEIEEDGKKATVTAAFWDKGSATLSHTGTIQIQP